MQSAPETPPISIARLARLSDLIFAVAMTLMALTFELPSSGELTSKDITQFLIAQFPSLGIYVITFVVIAFYWITHLHQFRYYERTDATHVWLTLLSLLFVVLMPYANDLISYYNTTVAIQIFYSLVAAGVGLFSTAAWIYATQNRRLVGDDLSDRLIRQIRQESYIEPLVTLLAIVGAWIHPWMWDATFLLIPILLFVQSKLSFKVGSD